MKDLKIENLRKVFLDQRTHREIVAVEDFSLEIAQGEFITLLGPSGCGKTTVLRMLAGFEEPSSGKILLSDKDVSQLPPHKRNSTMVFQSYALFPHMSVRENIAYGLRLKNLSKKDIEKRLQEILRLVSLQAYENRKPNELSGGQQQRVALARAITVEPDLLLFDEPLSNLDAKLRESMRVEIRNLQQRLGITSVYVTHDQIEALAISDRIVVMNKGNIEQVGSPLEIYFRPKTFFVADFMGATNFLDVELRPTKAGATFQFEGEEYEIESPWFQLDSPQQVKLVCRPEAIRLQGVSGVSAKVRELTYLGSHYEYVVETSHKRLLRARKAATPFEASYKVGEELRLDFDPNLLSWLPTEGRDLKAEKT